MEFRRKQVIVFRSNQCIQLTSSPLTSRDHPTTIKKRFFSVFIVMLISPLFVYFFSSSGLFKHFTIWEVMGLRVDGLLSATVIPLLLTMVLFLGPLSVQLTNGIWKVYSGWIDVTIISPMPILNIPFLFLEPMFWLNYCQNLLWLRNHVVAPLSEEFTFRACMMPLLLQTFSPMTAIFITPLFFGVGEDNHNWKSANEMLSKFLRLFQRTCITWSNVSGLGWIRKQQF